ARGRTTVAPVGRTGRASQLRRGDSVAWAWRAAHQLRRRDHSSRAGGAMRTPAFDGTAAAAAWPAAASTVTPASALASGVERVAAAESMRPGAAAAGWIAAEALPCVRGWLPRRRIGAGGGCVETT